MILNHIRYRGYEHPKYNRSLITGKCILHINRRANKLKKSNNKKFNMKSKHILINKYIRYKNNEPKNATLFYKNEI